MNFPLKYSLSPMYESKAENSVKGDSRQFLIASASASGNG
jgi:hypothetical protein